MLMIANFIGTPEVMGIALEHFGKTLYCKDEVIKPHTHAHLELCIPTTTKTTYLCEEHSYLLEPGDLCITKAGEYHAMESASNMDWQVDFINVRSLTYPDIRNAFGSTMVRVLRGCWDIHRLLETIIEEASQPSFGSTLMIHARVMELLLSVTRRAHAARSEGLPRPYTNSTYAAMNYISTQARFDLTVGEVAVMVGVSTSTLAHVFRLELGLTPRDYLRKVVTERAMRLLEYSSLSVTEIADKLGFPDLAGFSSFFKRQQGYSPREYRLSRQE